MLHTLQTGVIKKLCAGVGGILCLTMLLSALPVNSPVADAVMRGEQEAVRALLKQGVDVNAAQGDGMTALHWAATKGDVETARMLLYAGANVRATTRMGGYTPLLMAAKSGNAALLEAIVDAGADPNAANALGVTPLMATATSGNARAVQTLIDHGAEVNASEAIHGQTALMFAAARNRIDVIRTLVANGADLAMATKVRMPGDRPLGGNAPPTRGASAPATAANEPANEPDEEEQEEEDPLGGLTALLYATREGHPDAVRALLDAGSDVNETSGDNTTPLLMATINGRFDLAMLLLERGADPKIASTAGTTPLFATLNSQWAPHAFYPQPNNPSQERVAHLELMKALLDRGADPNARIKRELWYTYFNAAGQSGINEAGATPLWRAAQASDIDAMRLLIEAGADPHIPNNDGISPLNVAAGNGWRGNLNVNAPAGWMPAVRYLVDELDVDINSADKEGYTALHGAAERGDNEMILFLVARGANVKAETNRGETVADKANGPRQRIQPFPETVELLVSLGARNSNKCVSC